VSDALPPDVRRYGDREIAKILKRASQMQRESPARPDPSGLTLAELEEIAVEAGIDVENLRLAAAEVASVSDDSWQTGLFGAPLTQRLERSIPGELPPEAFGSLVPLLQVESGITGQVSTVGNALTWASTSNNSRSLSVLVIADNGHTKIQLEEKSSQVAVGLHVGMGSGSLGLAIPGGLALGAAAGVAAGLGAGIGVSGAFYLLARTLYKFTTNRRRRKIEVVFDRLATRIADLIAQHTVAAAAPAPAALPPPGPQ